MAHEVMWTKVIVEEFIKEAMLSKEEEEILRTRAAGWTRTEQSMKLGMSISKVDKIIRKLKLKYDHCQRTSVLLPPRRKSREERYMDTH